MKRSEFKKLIQIEAINRDMSLPEVAKAIGVDKQTLYPFLNDNFDSVRIAALLCDWAGIDKKAALETCGM